MSYRKNLGKGSNRYHVQFRVEANIPAWQTEHKFDVQATSYRSAVYKAVSKVLEDPRLRRIQVKGIGIACVRIPKVSGVHVDRTEEDLLG